MRAGILVPNGGAIATTEAVVRVAKHAEQLDYHTLWTFDRLIYAVKPRNTYPGTGDGSWPAAFRTRVG